jgi:hypothetical protein
MSTKINNFKYVFAILLVVFVSCGNKQQTQTETLKKSTEIADTNKPQIKKPFSGKIDIDSIPANAKNFIAKNYEGYKISSAAYDPLCGGDDAIDVAITKNGMPNYSLIFLLDGTFVQQEEDIPFSLAPDKVVKAVKEKYPDYQISKQIEKLKLADGSLQYLLDITKDSKTKEVILTEDGKIVYQSNN